MAKVVEGFLLGTHYDLTFYLMDGNLYVRMKSSLSRKKVKYSPRFKRTMQSAEELRRASKLASRIYWELSREQKKSVYVLYKKMTGVAKLAFKYGKSEAEAEREVREYLVREGVVKKDVKEKVEGKQVERVMVKKMVGGRRRETRVMHRVPSIFVVNDVYRRTERWKRRRWKKERLRSGKAPPDFLFGAAEFFDWSCCCRKDRPQFEKAGRPVNSSI